MNNLTITKPKQLPAEQFQEEPAAFRLTKSAVFALSGARSHDADGLARAETALAAMADRGPDIVAEAQAWAAQAQEPATSKEIAIHLAMLVGAFPNAAKQDLQMFGALLMADVKSKRPTRYALETALRKLRQTSRFLPSISEVCAALDNEAEYIKALAFVADRAAKEMTNPDVLLAQVRVQIADLREREADYEARRVAEWERNKQRRIESGKWDASMENTRPGSAAETIQ